MLILMAHVYNLFISETVAAINESKLQCHQFVFAFSDYTQKSLTILNLKKEYEKSKKNGFESYAYSHMFNECNTLDFRLCHTFLFDWNNLLWLIPTNIPITDSFDVIYFLSYLT